MKRLAAIALGLGALLSSAMPPIASAQQVNVETPFNSVGHSYYEQIGVRWGLRGNGWFFNFGGPVNPPFGGFDPNAGANFGFGGPNGFLNITAGQGSTTNFSSASPSVTVMNGHTGFFSDTVQRPFVTGLVPVVGEIRPPLMMPPPSGSTLLEERLHRLRTEGATFSPGVTSHSVPAAASSAEHGDLSVAEIKARRAVNNQAAQAEVEALLEKAAGARDAGKPGAAKVFLEMATRRAEAGSMTELLQRIKTAQQELDSAR